MLLISLYVDDLIYTGNDERMLQQFKENMMQMFEMTDLGKLHYFLGLEVQQRSEGIFISQKKYTETLLQKFKMQGCKSVSTPIESSKAVKKADDAAKAEGTRFRSLIGSLLYLTATRPDIMYATCLLSRFMQDPSQTHYGAGKRVLRYLQGTRNYGIFYARETGGSLLGFTDSDWGGSCDDFKSTSGYVFSFGSGSFSWSTKKQSTVALSTAEAEYIASAMAATQAMWLRYLLADMGEGQEEATLLHCDNKSAIAMIKNHVFHGRTKHINLKYHFVREAEEEGIIKMEHCSSENQIADIFTKALPKGRFQALRKKLGVTEMCTKEECQEMVHIS